MTEIMKGESEAIAKWEEICERHPEYTEAEKTCILYGLYAGKACEVCGNRIKQKLDYNKFVEANATLVGFNEKTLRPLIHEQDPEVQQKVISLSENLGNLKMEKLGTEKKMKKAISRAKGDKPIKEPEPPKQQVCSCSSCGGTDKDGVLVAVHILRQYDCPEDICIPIDKWIEEKYGK